MKGNLNISKTLSRIRNLPLEVSFSQVEFWVLHNWEAKNNPELEKWISNWHKRNRR